MNKGRGKGYKGDKSKKKSNINVAIKVRPLIDKEISKREFSIVKAESNLIVRIIRLFSTQLTLNMRKKSRSNSMFTIGR